MTRMNLLTPKEWSKAAAKAAMEKDWEVFDKLKIDVNQRFTQKRNWDGLQRFYTEVLQSSVEPDVVKKVAIKNLSKFEVGVERCLRKAVKEAAKDSSIQVIYFEYFYDGGDSCSGSVFLCTAYRDDEDYWASEFDPDGGVIEGPSVFEYFHYDPKLEFDPFTSAVSNAYVDGLLLAAWGRAVDKQGLVKLPMGFAEHGKSIIKLRYKWQRRQM